MRRGARARGADAPAPTVTALVAAARRGDRDAFDELVRRTYRQVYTLALRLTADDEDARDATQETFLRAFRAIGGFRGDAQFETWLYRIAVNASLSLRVRRARHRHELLDDRAAALPTRGAGTEPAEPANAPEERWALHDRLEAALARLPERWRAVVVLRDVYDLPHEEIARQLGVSVNATKIRLHRARRRLRAELEGRRAGEGAA